MKIKDRAKPKLPPVAPGVYLAVCVHSIDLGEQMCEYKGSKTYNNQVQLVFELAGETVEIDGKPEPRTLSRTFNVTRSKNGGLRKFIQSWLGQTFSDDAFSEFDPNSLVGLPVQVSVVLNESGEYANIDAAMQLPKGMPAPNHSMPLIRYDMEPWDDASFNALPEWAQNKIKKSSQYAKLHAPDTVIDITPPAPQPAPQPVIDITDAVLGSSPSQEVVPF